MKFLAWDTSAKTGAIVALEWTASAPKWSDVRCVGEWALNVDSQHSGRLLWGIHQLLEASHWKLEDVDLFGVGVGPGSFTGLRIGVTTARTLAHATGKPLIPVSSLAALARPAALWASALGSDDTFIVTATDACKGELFALFGTAAQLSKPKRTIKELVIEPENLVKKVSAKLERTTAWLAIGEGRARYEDEWSKLPLKRELKIDIPFKDQVQGRYLGMLAFEAWQAGLAAPALEVHPLYLRASDAELKLKAGLLPKVALAGPA